MKTKLLLAALAFALAACGDDPDSLTGRRNTPPGTSTDSTLDPAALQCTAKPQGRSYALFDGTKLETTRVNEASGVNRARQKPFGVLAGEYQRVLGVVPASLAKSGGSFDDPPPRWFAEVQYGGVSLHAMFDISFEACSAYDMGPGDDEAKCTSLMKKAWNRTPNPSEIDACVDLAKNKLAAETDPKRRSAYVCASILSSSQFLTF